MDVAGRPPKLRLGEGNNRPGEEEELPERSMEAAAEVVEAMAEAEADSG